MAMHDVQQKPVSPECDEHVTVIRIRPLVPILNFSESYPRPFGTRADAPDAQLGLAVNRHITSPTVEVDRAAHVAGLPDPEADDTW
jgi:hypothetical protein